MSTADRTDRPTGAGGATAAQARVIAAAMALFAEHGVGGTSLQMIADRLGITKAGIYHHYKTKDDIVVAAAEEELARMEATIDAAESEPTWPRARKALLANMVDLAVERRRLAGTLLNDPAVTRIVPHNASYRRVMRRMNRMLMGSDAGPEAELKTAMLIAAISGAAVNTVALELDDDVLRTQLLQLATTLLLGQPSDQPTAG